MIVIVLIIITIIIFSWRRRRSSSHKSLEGESPSPVHFNILLRGHKPITIAL